MKNVIFCAVVHNFLSFLFLTPEKEDKAMKIFHGMLIRKLDQNRN